MDADAKKDELYLVKCKENQRLNSELRKIRKANKELINRICLFENKTP